MPISKEALGIHGEHLLADEDGYIPTEGDTAEALNWGDKLHPGHREGPSPEAGGHAILYESWEHYHRCCLAAAQRAHHARIAAESGGVEIAESAD